MCEAQHEACVARAEWARQEQKKEGPREKGATLTTGLQAM